MLSGGSKGSIIQVDRLIFDRRNEIKKISILPNELANLSPSSTILNFFNEQTSNISRESYVSFSSDQIQIVRLTLDHFKNENRSLNHHPHKIDDQRSLTNFKDKDQSILSPVYESIDSNRNI